MLFFAVLGLLLIVAALFLLKYIEEMYLSGDKAERLGIIACWLGGTGLAIWVVELLAWAFWVSFLS